MQVIVKRSHLVESKRSIYFTSWNFKIFIRFHLNLLTDWNRFNRDCNAFCGIAKVVVDKNQWNYPQIHTVLFWSNVKMKRFCGKFYWWIQSSRKNALEHSFRLEYHIIVDVIVMRLVHVNTNERLSTIAYRAHILGFKNFLIITSPLSPNPSMLLYEIDEVLF